MGASRVLRWSPSRRDSEPAREGRAPTKNLVSNRRGGPIGVIQWPNGISRSTASVSDFRGANLEQRTRARVQRVRGCSV